LMSSRTRKENPLLKIGFREKLQENFTRDNF
jgi:hypothetical protein